MAKASEFKPKIIGFLCNWCCYGGADLCGVSRYQYPPYLRVVRLMCSGRVDLAFVFRAFAQGIDGVFIGGCHLNDCHYNPEGNYDAFANTAISRKLLAHLGINPERLRLEWVSAGEGIRFADIMNDFSLKVKKLGPLGFSEGTDINELKSGIEAVTGLIPYIKLVEREKLRPAQRTQKEYDRYFTSAEFTALFDELILDKLAVSRIMAIVGERPRATGEIAEISGLAPTDVTRHISAALKQGLLAYDANRQRFALA